MAVTGYNPLKPRGGSLQEREIRANFAAFESAVNALQSGSQSTSYTPNGTGAAARTVAGKLQDFISATDFSGVDSTGVADSTTGLQAFFDYVTQNSKAGVIPSGTYKITAPITIGVTSTGTFRWTVEGYGAAIVQYTNNVAIIKFTKEFNRRFAIRGLQLGYNNQQSSSNTSANAIEFNSDTDNNFGHYLFTLADIYFNQCYGGIVSVHIGNRNPVWQCVFERCEAYSNHTGPVVDLRPTGTGQPDIHIRNMYVRGDNIATVAVMIGNGYSVMVTGYECITPTYLTQLQFETCKNVIVDAFRLERGTFSDTNARGAILFSVADGIVRGCEIQQCTFTGTSANYYAIKLSGASYVEASYLVSASQTTSNGANLYAFDVASTGLVRHLTKILGSGGMSEVLGGTGPDQRVIRPGGWRRFTLADDTAATFSLTTTTAQGEAVVIVRNAAANSGSVIYDATSGASFCSVMTGSGANFLAGTTALAGTTGTDVKLNVAAASGNFYVENRTGASQFISVLLPY